MNEVLAAFGVEFFTFMSFYPFDMLIKDDLADSDDHVEDEICNFVLWEFRCLHLVFLRFFLLFSTMLQFLMLWLTLCRKTCFGGAVSCEELRADVFLNTKCGSKCMS